MIIQRVVTLMTIVIFSLFVWGTNLTKEVESLDNIVKESTVKPDISDKDIRWLALNIYHEARGESITGMFAVGIVTLNRVESPLYPNTIESVVKQRNQFSWYRPGRSDDIWDGTSWEVSKSVAQILLTKEDLRIKKRLGDAMYYHSTAVHPIWSKKKRLVAKIDNHIFYL